MTASAELMSQLHGPGLTDVRSMLMAHDAFRRCLLPVPELVRGVTDGDRRRAGVVADHVHFVLGMLEHHHEAEDELLWPVLLERVPDELAPIVHLMEGQHEGVHAALEEVDALLPSWHAAPTTAAGGRLADRIDHLLLLLDEHLRAEETRLLPIAARTVSQAEWEAVGERSLKGVPPAKGPVVFGILMEVGDPELVAADLAKAPAPVRLLLRLTARRAWARYSRRVLEAAPERG